MLAFRQQRAHIRGSRPRYRFATAGILFRDLPHLPPTMLPKSHPQCGPAASSLLRMSLRRCRPIKHMHCLLPGADIIIQLGLFVPAVSTLPEALFLSPGWPLASKGKKDLASSCTAPLRSERHKNPRKQSRVESTLSPCCCGTFAILRYSRALGGISAYSIHSPVSGYDAM